MSTNSDRVIIGQIQQNGKYYGKNHLNEDIYKYEHLLIKITPNGEIRWTEVSFRRNKQALFGTKLERLLPEDFNSDMVSPPEFVVTREYESNHYHLCEN